MNQKDCANCNGWIWNDEKGKWIRTRKTFGMVCPNCGYDYLNDRRQSHWSRLKSALTKRKQ